jgi:hypothetical protein
MSGYKVYSLDPLMSVYIRCYPLDRMLFFTPPAPPLASLLRKRGQQLEEGALLLGVCCPLPHAAAAEGVDESGVSHEECLELRESATWPLLSATHSAAVCWKMHFVENALRGTKGLRRWRRLHLPISDRDSYIYKRVSSSPDPLRIIQPVHCRATKYKCNGYPEQPVAQTCWRSHPAGGAGTRQRHRRAQHTGWQMTGYRIQPGSKELQFAVCVVPLRQPPRSQSNPAPQSLRSACGCPAQSGTPKAQCTAQSGTQPLSVRPRTHHTPVPSGPAPACGRDKTPVGASGGWASWHRVRFTPSG